MEFLYIILAVCGLVLVAAGVAVSIEVSVNLGLKHEEKALKKYFRHKGKKDIETLETYLTNNNISVPYRATSEIDTFYVKRLLNRCYSYNIGILKDNLKQAGYEKNVAISGFATIYYNSENAIVYEDVFSCFYDRPCIKSREVLYKHNDEAGNEYYCSLSRMIEVYESFGEPDAYKDLGVQIPLKDLYWYVEHPTSAGYKLADTAAGAIVGGVLFGPVGALAGGMSTSKSQKKEESNEIKVVLGGKSIGWWYAAEGEDRTNQAVETLTEYFPKNKYKDGYKKHL